MLSRGLYETVPEGGIAAAMIFEQMPTVLSAVIFVGICSAIMSTMDSLINTGALVLTIDLYRPKNKIVSDKHLVKTGRYATLFVALLSLFI